MKHLILITALLVTGCASNVPVVAKFPDVPKDMLVACPDLTQIPDTTKLSEVLPVVADNYGQYYICRSKLEGWIDWYNQQKDIFNKIK